MSAPLDVPRHSYEELRKHADRFLRSHNPTGTIPVPIEEIVEFEFGMNIVPIPGLHQGYEIDGFISGDLSEISVDQFVYESRPGRYRFTWPMNLDMPCCLACAAASRRSDDSDCNRFSDPPTALDCVSENWTHFGDPNPFISGSSSPKYHFEAYIASAGLIIGIAPCRKTGHALPVHKRFSKKVPSYQIG
jgi:hypothetical protein